MINLSQFARKSPEYSLFRKIRSLRDPDIYLAENIMDYRENAQNLEYSWYKKSFFCHDFMNRAYISIMNVGLRKLLTENEVEIPNWFVIHDDTAGDIVY